MKAIWIFFIVSRFGVPKSPWATMLRATASFIVCCGVLRVLWARTQSDGGERRESDDCSQLVDRVRADTDVVGRGALQSVHYGHTARPAHRVPHH